MVGTDRIHFFLFSIIVTASFPPYATIPEEPKLDLMLKK